MQMQVRELRRGPHFYDCDRGRIVFEKMNFGRLGIQGGRSDSIGACKAARRTWKVLGTPRGRRGFLTGSRMTGTLAGSRANGAQQKLNGLPKVKRRQRLLQTETHCYNFRLAC